MTLSDTFAFLSPARSLSETANLQAPVLILAIIMSSPKLSFVISITRALVISASCALRKELSVTSSNKQQDSETRVLVTRLFLKKFSLTYRGWKKRPELQTCGMYLKQHQSNRATDG